MDELVDQHDELVAAEPRDRARVTDGLAQHVGGRLDQRIAHQVAERVVDVLETIEIDQHHRHAPLAIRGGHDQVAHRLAQKIAVRQPGQAVVPRQMLDTRFGFLPLRRFERQREHQRRRVGKLNVVVVPCT